MGVQSSLKSNEIMRVFQRYSRRAEWQSYDFSYNNCIDFVFKFVNAITGGRAYDKSVWPECFIENDEIRVENGGDPHF